MGSFIALCPVIAWAQVSNWAKKDSRQVPDSNGGGEELLPDYEGVHHTDSMYHSYWGVLRHIYGMDKYMVK